MQQSAAARAFSESAQSGKTHPESATMCFIAFEKRNLLFLLAGEWYIYIEQTYNLLHFSTTNAS